MLISTADFEALPLRVHDFLSAPRLMDVRAIALDGGGPNRNVGDIIAMLEAANGEEVNPFVRALFQVRVIMGRLFGWDKDSGTETPAAESYVHRLPDEWATASHDTPGLLRGPTRILYRFDEELLAEVINSTAHAFISFSMFPRDDQSGYTAYLAVYAINTKWWTRYYLALIEPFRRFIVYPGLIRAFQRRWATHIQQP